MRMAGDHRDAGEPGAGRAFDGFSAHGRQVEAQILAALGRLHQHAAAGFGANAPGLAQPRHARQQPVGALDVLDRHHMPVDHDHGLADVEGPERAEHLPPFGDVSGGSGIGRGAGNASLRHQDIGGDIPDADHPKTVLFEDAADPRQQMIVAAAKRRQDAAEDADRSPVQPDFRQRRAQQRADEDQVAAALAAEQFCRAAELPDRDPVMAEARDASRIAGAAEREQHRRDPALAQQLRHRERHGAAACDDADGRGNVRSR